MSSRPLTYQDRQAEVFGQFKAAGKKLIEGVDKKRPVDIAEAVRETRAAVLQALEWGL